MSSKNAASQNNWTDGIIRSSINIPCCSFNPGKSEFIEPLSLTKCLITNFLFYRARFGI
jgi:hypothetical protein